MPILNLSARRNFHFALTPRIQTLRSAALNCGGGAKRVYQYAAIGQFMHALQDTFAHRDHMSITSFALGHVFSGHAPDQPWTEPASFRQMFSATFDELVAIRGVCGVQSTNTPMSRAPFDAARAKVDAWANYEAQNVGDELAVERWSALVPKVFGAKFEAYTVTRLAEYVAWTRNAWR